MLCCRGLWTLLFLLVSVTVVAAQDFLHALPPSPQAAGRGGIYATSETDDPLAPLSNPALLGLTAGRHRVLTGFFTRHAYQRAGDNTGWATRTLLFGFDRHTLSQVFGQNIPLNLGIGYQETRMELGAMYDWQPPDMQRVRVPENFEVTRGFTLAAGIAGRHGQAALGFGHLYTQNRMGLDEYHRNVTSSDFGLYGEWMLSSYLMRQAPADPLPPLRPLLSASLGYALQNVGPASRLSVSSREWPLPRKARLGLGLRTGIETAHPLGAGWQILALSGGIEVEDVLVAYGPNGTWKYQHLLGDIRPAHLLFGPTDHRVEVGKGFELELLEAVYLRSGYRQIYWTQGLALRLTGLLKLITLDPAARNDRTMSFIARHLDLQYDYGEQEYRTYEDDIWRSSRATFSQLSLRYRS